MIEIATIITLSLGITGIFTGLIYFIITFKKDMKIADNNLQESKKQLQEMEQQTKQMDLELEESKKQTQEIIQQTEEMKYSNKLSLYELGIIKDKPIPPKHLQNPN